MGQLTPLYSSEQIRQCERQANQKSNRDAFSLMEQAGSDAFVILQKTFPDVRRIAVFCGAGNNAGDGYILANEALSQGYEVVVYACKSIEDLPPAAQLAAYNALDAGLLSYSLDEPLDNDVELIVDALLGTGLKGAVRGNIANAIVQINDSGVPILSLDIPSGLHADTGVADTYCVKANVTATFIGPKIGMYTLDGPDVCGHIFCCHLDLDVCLDESAHAVFLMSESTVSLPLPQRKKNVHKKDFGHVLIIGGGVGMPGSVVLAAKAAMRTGAGMVSVATWPNHVCGASSLLPEAMIYGVRNEDELLPLLEKCTFCVVGPGLGDDDWAHRLFDASVSSQLPMVVDASALRLLGKKPQLDDNWILTPHPGEAAALLSCSIEEIQANRVKAVQAIHRQYGGVVVLKGSGSLVYTLDKKTFVCPKGNPGMSSAGMGDVLSGIIAGICAQGYSLSDAGVSGVWAHAVAGDKAVECIGKIGILASDVCDFIPGIVQ